MIRNVIKDFVEDLNYKNVILYIGDCNLDDLRDKMTHDYMGHLYRLDYLNDDCNLFFVENCDLNIVEDDEIKDFIVEGYTITPLQYDNGEYYYKVGV